MSAAPLTTGQLRQLAAELPHRYTTPLMHLLQARLLSGRQLDRLLVAARHGEPDGRTARQRTLSRLDQLGLVATLDRRIGGVHAGSAGHVHVLRPAEQKLAALPAASAAHTTYPPPNCSHSSA